MFMDKRHSATMARIYWATDAYSTFLLPQLLWLRRLRVNQPLIVLICLGVIVGMWCERYDIVVTSLQRPHLPSAWGNFHGTFWDWATLLGTVGLFLSGILLVVRLLPVDFDARDARAVQRRQARTGRAAPMRGILSALSKLRRRCNSAVERLDAENIDHRDLHAEICRMRNRVGSPLPLVMFIAGLLGAGAFSAHEAYARRRLSPGHRRTTGIRVAGFVPIAFELGVLCAMGAGFFGYFLVCRMPKLYEAVDECAFHR